MVEEVEEEEKEEKMKKRNIRKSLHNNKIQILEHRQSQPISWAPNPPKAPKFAFYFISSGGLKIFGN